MLTKYRNTFRRESLKAPPRAGRGRYVAMMDVDNFDHLAAGVSVTADGMVRPRLARASVVVPAESSIPDLIERAFSHVDGR